MATSNSSSSTNSNITFSTAPAYKPFPQAPYAYTKPTEAEIQQSLKGPFTVISSPTGGGQRVGGGGSPGNVPIASAALATASMGVSQEVQKPAFIQAPPTPSYSVNRVNDTKSFSQNNKPVSFNLVNQNTQQSITPASKSPNLSQGVGKTSDFAGGIFDIGGGLARQSFILTKKYTGNPNISNFLNSPEGVANYNIYQSTIAKRAENQIPLFGITSGGGLLEGVPGTRLTPIPSVQSNIAAGKQAVYNHLIDTGYSIGEAQKRSDAIAGVSQSSEFGNLGSQVFEATLFGVGSIPFGKAGLVKPLTEKIAQEGGALTVKQLAAQRFAGIGPTTALFGGGQLVSNYATAQGARNQPITSQGLGQAALIGTVGAGFFEFGYNSPNQTVSGITKGVGNIAYPQGAIARPFINLATKNDPFFAMPIVRIKPEVPIGAGNQTNFFSFSGEGTVGKPSGGTPESPKPSSSGGSKTFGTRFGTPSSNADFYSNPARSYATPETLKSNLIGEAGGKAPDTTQPLPSSNQASSNKGFFGEGDILFNRGGTATVARTNASTQSKPLFFSLEPVNSSSRTEKVNLVGGYIGESGLIKASSGTETVNRLDYLLDQRLGGIGITNQTQNTKVKPGEATTPGQQPSTTTKPTITTQNPTITFLDYQFYQTNQNYITTPGSFIETPAFPITTIGPPKIQYGGVPFIPPFGFNLNGPGIGSGRRSNERRKYIDEFAIARDFAGGILSFGKRREHKKSKSKQHHRGILWFE